MNRRRFLKSTASLGIALASPPLIARAAAKELLVAEPVHSTGYLPMYIAMANNYFAESDIVVNIVTIETGSGHTNAVLSGQAFAFIGGPEHDAFAKAKGAELRAIVHCVDRGNVYINAVKGQEPKDTQLAGLFQRQIDSARSLQRNAEFDHALSARQMESRRQARRQPDRGAELGCSRRGQGRAGHHRRGDRAHDHPGHPVRAVGGAVLQRAEGARALRLFHHQCAARTRSRRSRKR